MATSLQSHSEGAHTFQEGHIPRKALH